MAVGEAKTVMTLLVIFITFKDLNIAYHWNYVGQEYDKVTEFRGETTVASHAHHIDPVQPYLLLLPSCVSI